MSWEKWSGGGAICALCMLCLLAASAAPSRAEARASLQLGPDGAITLGGLSRGAPLREAAGHGPAPGGRLGFRSGGRWWHARSLARPASSAEGERFELLLETDDPNGRRIRVRVRVRGREVVLRALVVGEGPPVERIGVGFESAGGERYLGFGERSNAVDQRGNTIVNYVGEGPYPPEEYAIIRNTVPLYGFRESVDATYFPMPWLLSTRGYGVLAENTQTSRFRLGSARRGEWSIEADAGRLVLRFFGGPTPAAVVRRLTGFTGRQPEAAAPWQWGPWFQTGHSNTEPDEIDHADVLREADAPVSVVETHMRYMPCGSDVGQESAERARTAAFHRRGLAALTYTREAICGSYSGPYRRAVAGDAFFERANGEPYTFDGFVGSGLEPIGMLDFTDPEAMPIYESILDRAYAAGYDGWMEDYGEYVAPDAIAENGLTGRRMHNLHPVLYHQAGYEYAVSKRRPIIRFTRSGWTGAHPYTQIKWGGDPTTGWGFDGLASAVIEALTMGLSGISTWGSDIGGFFTLSDERLDPELLARWIEFGAFSGVMRTKAEGIGVPKSARPQIWERPTLPLFRRYAKLRTQLYPMIVAADAEYRRSGLPIMRHLALAYPRDRRAAAIEDQFMFGDDLLVAPVLVPGASERRAYLPRGRWIDFWRSIAYRNRSGGLAIEGARILRGRRSARLPAPLEEIPVLIRAGAILPLLPADVDTLAPYGKRRRDLVALGERRGRLHVLAFPRGRSAARLGELGRLRARERRGGLRLAVAASRRLDLDLEISTAALRRPFRPREVRIGGRAVGGWSFDRKASVLRIRTSLRRGRITIR